MPQQKNAGPRPTASPQVLAWPDRWHLNRNAHHNGTFIRRLVEAFHDVKKKIPRLESFYNRLISKHYGKGK